MTRVLFQSNADRTSSATALCEALGEALRAAGHMAEVRVLVEGGSRREKMLAPLRITRARWRALRRAEVVIVPTAVVFSAFEIVMARLMGKRVKVIFWDQYPEGFTALGQRGRWFYGPWKLAERGLLRLSHGLMPPSADYLPEIEAMGMGEKACVQPMWPFTQVHAPPMRQG